ncbi:MAG: bifunctional DNA primase/polymerase [Luteolibacter sp.]
MDPNKILQLLGVRAVLLPIRAKSKAPAVSSWQKLTFEDTQSDWYQSLLQRAPAIAVLLGDASEGLCSIDCDSDDYLGEFLELNPRLADSFRTKGRRGANIWLILETAGQRCPSTKRLYAGDVAVGEFRADGGQTIVAGRHEKGGTYQVLCCSPPVRIRPNEIAWPGGKNGPGSLGSSKFSQDSDSSPNSASSVSLGLLNLLHNNEKINESLRAEEELAADPVTGRYYKKFLAKKFTAQQGMRNDHMVQMVTFLHEAVSKELCMKLVRFFYLINQVEYNDSLEHHMKAAEAHYNACDVRWLQGFGGQVRAPLAELPDRHRCAMRICSALARLDLPESPAGEFYLSCNELGDRLCLHPPQAQRILKQFESFDMILMLQPGSKRETGKKARATRYKWLI